LLEALREHGIGGDSLRKASSFFLQAAAFAGLPLSPHFGPVRKGTAGPRKPPKKRTAKPAGSGHTTGEQERPAGGSVDAMKKAYIDLLIAKAAAQDNPDDALLDRIERALGMEGVQ
jgi:hypothetical protein